MENALCAVHQRAELTRPACARADARPYNHVHVYPCTSVGSGVNRLRILVRSMNGGTPRSRI